MVTSQIASAQSIHPGDRVMVKSLNYEKGVALDTTPLPSGSAMIRVHLDRFGPQFPDQAVSLDEKLSGVMKDSSPAPGTADPNAPVDAPH